MKLREVIGKYEEDEIYNYLILLYPKLREREDVRNFVLGIVELSKRVVTETVLHVEHEGSEEKGFNVFFTKYRNNTHCYNLDYLKEEELVNSKIVPEEVSAIGELPFIAHIFNFLIEGEDEWFVSIEDDKLLKIEEIRIENK